LKIQLKHNSRNKSHLNKFEHVLGIAQILFHRESAIKLWKISLPVVAPPTSGAGSLPPAPLLEDAGALAPAVGAPEVTAASAAVTAVVGAAVAGAPSPHARPPRHPQGPFLLAVHEEAVEELAVVVVGGRGRVVGGQGEARGGGGA